MILFPDPTPFTRPKVGYMSMYFRAENRASNVVNKIGREWVDE
jgi:hypothetical protein